MQEFSDLRTSYLGYWLLKLLRILKELMQIRVIIQHPFGKTLPHKSFDDQCYTGNRFQILRETIRTEGTNRQRNCKKLRFLNAGAGFHGLDNLLFPESKFETILDRNAFFEQWEYNTCDLFPLTWTPHLKDPTMLKGKSHSHTVCDLSEELPDSIKEQMGLYDYILCTDVLEHVRNPAVVVDNLVAMCRRGAIIYLATPFSYPYHPDPEDFWRFTPDCLQMLLMDSAKKLDWRLEITHKGWDITQRRKNLNNRYSVPTDSLGGWREKWDSYLICRVQ